jgi:hypothetical protein
VHAYAHRNPFKLQGIQSAEKIQDLKMVKTWRQRAWQLCTVGSTISNIGLPPVVLTHQSTTRTRKEEWRNTQEVGLTRQQDAAAAYRRRFSLTKDAKTASDSAPFVTFYKTCSNNLSSWGLTPLCRWMMGDVETLLWQRTILFDFSLLMDRSMEHSDAYSALVVVKSLEEWRWSFKPRVLN